MDSFVLSVLEASKKIIEHFRHGDPALYMKQGEGAGGDESLHADLLCEEIFASYLKQYGTIMGLRLHFVIQKIGHKKR